jgi:hypothetical protein
MGLAAPKTPPAPKTAAQKIPAVISCLAGETYQARTKTCSKTAKGSVKKAAAASPAKKSAR